MITSTKGTENVTFNLYFAQKICFQYKLHFRICVIPNSYLYLGFSLQSNECNCCLSTTSDYLQGVPVNL